jgi:hypothetical protein
MKRGRCTVMLRLCDNQGHGVTKGVPFSLNNATKGTKHLIFFRRTYAALL